MQAEASALPSSTTKVELEGKTVYLVGTAHVSAQSVQDVRDTVAAVRPDTIAIELCEPRYQGMVKKAAWQHTNLFQVIKQGKATFLLAQLAMQSFYRRLGKQLEVEPGAEMLAAATCAEETGARLELIDRRIDLTLKRVWRHLGFWQRLKLFSVMFQAMFSSEKIQGQDIEALKKQDQLEALMGEMGKAFPEIKKRLIDERDVYLAQKLRAAPGGQIVAVVGAGHVPGMLKAIREPMSVAELESLPPRTRWSKIWPWLIPAGVIALIAWGFFQGGAERGVDSIAIWVGVTGTLGALGALVSLAHPLTILSAFLAAPITTLHPALAAGWVAGLVQAWLRPPSVGDFEALPEAMESMSAFFRNPVIRILLVVALTNIGSSIGTFVAIPWIAAR
ncbi:MAG: TraB/GumN family protein [Kiritimatiellae bacterium]|jgi:pheromone shutdown-related protein TraB|nr:TraB/GumN family protein [Kiritimatiellia bacterium]NLD90535.1 TraB/GumN family protein [Lentisphaerota bacterium]